MSKKSVLVTGGLGFIGSNLVDMLIEAGSYQVTVLDSRVSESAYIEYKNSKATYIIDDVCNIDTWSDKIGKSDIIFHLAGHARIQPSFIDPINTIRSNVLGTVYICEYAKRNKSKVIYAGSSSFYAGFKLSPYAFAKHMGEEVCTLFSKIDGVKTVVARFFNVYGPRQPLIGTAPTVIGIFERQCKNNEPLTIVGDGEQRRDFTHVSDICRGLIAMGEKDVSGIYDLGTGVNYSIREIADLIIVLSNFKVSKIHLPIRPGEYEETLADISKTTKDLGWVPKYNLMHYLEKVIK